MKTFNHNDISMQAAFAACNEAVKKAEELKIKINVSICDSAGLELAFLRMNGSYIHSINIAKDKAYTSASFGFSTATWTDIFKEASHLEQGFSNRDRLIPFGGGLPIMNENELIGAIGVSGGTEEEDIICAQAGINKIV
ncbi:heme-binding protein [Arcobacter sp. LA11]|uniref:GlcG/HbpS family heme-binding protein n=1 Tax=Arcobacter sp. LA11 TaxID=1898176 RepID=UPI000934C3FB|nr:heme-binding protein [Arcobacter sp. LA11]